MGKLIRNGIEYGGGNGTDIFEVTQAEYDALEQADTLVHNALYVITNAPNLNPTASDIEYTSGVSVADALGDRYTKTQAESKFFQFVPQGTLGSGNDFNSVLTQGLYKVGNITQVTNAPSGVGYSGLVFVYVYDSYIMQDVWCDSGHKYRFSYNSGSTWSAWA